MASWDAAALFPASLPSHDPPDEACTSGSRGQHPLPSLQYQSAVWYQRLSLKELFNPPPLAMADPFVSVASATFGQERSSVLVTPVCLVDGQEAVCG
ncbi:hypothetical protein HaLaN_15669 [Haematococcus lacustris]|uniref:Uncharacterized protein n=1 Tax=Haematococcus lacustris TaxID=44745 RepID=A0A699ZJS5_HAELA|nr:hypothetical protein HaLaN_15669 [Haematococcus lacustris]